MSEPTATEWRPSGSKEGKTRIFGDLSHLYTLWRDTSLGVQDSEKREVNFLSSLFMAHKVESAIDLGGGVGTHAIPLSEEAYDITLFDKSDKAIAIARKKNPKLKSFQGSFENIELDKVFDASISMWSTLSYVHGEQAQRHFYGWIAAHTRQLIVLDQPNFVLYPQKFHKTYSGKDPNYAMKITRDWKMDGRIKRTQYVYEVTNKETQKVETFKDSEIQEYLPLDTISGYLGKNWRMEKAYGDYNAGTDFNPAKSERMIATFVPV